MESIMLVTNGMGLNKRQSNNTEVELASFLQVCVFPLFGSLGILFLVQSNYRKEMTKAQLFVVTLMQSHQKKKWRLSWGPL